MGYIISIVYRIVSIVSSKLLFTIFRQLKISRDRFKSNSFNNLTVTYRNGLWYIRIALTVGFSFGISITLFEGVQIARATFKFLLTNFETPICIIAKQNNFAAVLMNTKLKKKLMEGMTILVDSTKRNQIL